MKRFIGFALCGLMAVGLLQRLLAQDGAVSEHARAASGPGHNATPIPLDQIGAVAEKRCSRDGLFVAATEGGALLRCVFQRMSSRATAEGLWITSTVNSAKGEPFRVIARAVGRGDDGFRSKKSLARFGVVEAADKLVRFVRPELTEQYSVSMDGVRQDFIIDRRPEGEGPMRVELHVDRAKAEQLAEGARLVLTDGGRKLAYSRLRAEDARGRVLNAHLEVLAENRLAVLVDDASAEYPLRIDPTFSDANWISMGGILGANGTVRSVVADDAGDLYIGGFFSIVGDIAASNIAKWNGTSWSALGSGVDNMVYALAVSSSTLYASGYFTNAGGVWVNNIAKWDGSSWSALSSSPNASVSALAVSGSDLYAGGTSPRQARFRPAASPNGTGVRGRFWARG
jgi:hypothetical protein